MCGLTGVTMHPDSSDPVRVLCASVFDDLLVRTQSRGHHATGVAAMALDKTVLTAKRAEPARAFVQRTEYKGLLDAMADGKAMMLLGHTRWATHGAASQDENAHPFTFGKVTGAHNGIITNWREIEGEMRKSKRPEVRRGFTVDSEAAFALLNAMKRPQDALAKLEGYFALTWMKGASLFIARTDAPLTMMYVKPLRALFWNSERSKLAEALKVAGIDADSNAVIVYEPTPGKVYRYTPASFANDATNVAHVGTFPFTVNKRIDYARPNASGASYTRRRAGGATTSTVTTGKHATPGWDPVLATQHKRDELMPSLRGDRTYSWPEMSRKLDEGGRRIIALETKLARTEGRLTEAFERIDELLDMLGMNEDDGARGPYADDPHDARATQLTLPVARAVTTGDATGDVTTYEEGGVCEMCRFMPEPGNPLVTSDEYGTVHRSCLPQKDPVTH